MSRRNNNIWNKEDFQMCGLGEPIRLVGIMKHIKKCIIWSWQRIVRGYADCDKRHMCDFLQMIIPKMLQNLRDKRSASPAYLGENYTNAEGVLVNDTCHEEWNILLDRMIFLWKEMDIETCTMKNPYYDEYSKARDEFHEKYGFFGEKLQSNEELEANRNRGGGGTVHFMDELPEYKKISDKYHTEERRIEKYRKKCKDEAMDLLKEHFFALWDL